MASKLQFQKLSEDATIPTRAHDGDAGLDLYSAVETTVPASSTVLVATDICVRLPEPPVPNTSVYGRIAERSGLALKKSITIGGGVIDKAYTGSLGVIVHNHSETDFSVRRGDRVAQFIVEVCMTPDVQEVNNITGAGSVATGRGERGFGSSGD